MAALVAEILHIDHAAADAFAQLVTEQTRGNPYETVELLNTLRHDGLLVPTSTGWWWDEPAVRSRLAGSEQAELPTARLAALPTSLWATRKDRHDEICPPWRVRAQGQPDRAGDDDVARLLALRHAGALVIDEEEKAIVDDGAAKGATEDAAVQ